MFVVESGAVDQVVRLATISHKTGFHNRVMRMQVLFRPGDPPDEIFVIESGAVECVIDYTLSSPVSRRLAAAAASGDGDVAGQSGRCDNDALA